MSEVKDPDAETPVSAVAADIADERLILSKGPAGIWHLIWNRLKGGELGTLPVIVGLIVICAVFYAREPAFLSSRSLVTLTQFAAPTGIIALGIVLVLLLGEIDLSVGSVAGFTSAIMAVMVTNKGASLVGRHAGRARCRRWRSVSSTPCSTRSWACRASCSPWPACWPSRERCSTRSATRARSPCPRTPPCVSSPATSSSPTPRPTSWSRSRWWPTSAATSSAIRRRQAAGLTPPPVGLMLVEGRRARCRAGVLLLLPRDRRCARRRLPLHVLRRCWSS